MKVLSLKCVNCGASIEIGPETDTFACSYCGTQQMVKRSGGIVVLQRIGAALDEVKRGTNRTASELALRRLWADVSAIEVQRDSAVSALRAKDESNSAIIGWALLAGVPGAIFLFGWWSILVVVAGFVFGWHPTKLGRLKQTPRLE